MLKSFGWILFLSLTITCVADMALAGEAYKGDGEGYSELKCKDVSGRWQICGDAGRNKLVLGVGIHVMKPSQDGTLVAASDVHPSCDAALADESVPASVRRQAETVCGDVFAQAVGSLATPVPVLVDTQGNLLSYDFLSRDERLIVGQAVNDIRAHDPGGQAIGCSLGPGIAISCWGGGWMCAAWIDEDGPGRQCWACDVADCD